MKIILVTISFWLCVSVGWAADLAWDYDADHETITEFLLVFDDESSYCSQKTAGHCVYRFPASETIVEGGMVVLSDVESRLNLQPGIEYTFQLARRNEIAESGFSNTATYAVPPLEWPSTDLPPPVSSPSGANGLRIE